MVLRTCGSKLHEGNSGITVALCSARCFPCGGGEVGFFHSQAAFSAFPLQELFNQTAASVLTRVCHSRGGVCNF